MLSSQYTISQLARAVGVPVTTLRYYERAGLVEPEDRSAGNYRLYSDASLQRLRFIRAAQCIGFALNDVKALLGSPAGRPPTCPDVQQLIESRLADIEKRLHELRTVQRVLKTALQKCRDSTRANCCRVITSLEETARRNKR